MILVDKALERREAEGRPIRVALVGAGTMGVGVAAQLLTPLPGLRLVVVASRDARRGRASWAGRAREAVIATSRSALERAIAAGRPAVVEEAGIACEADGVDVVLEATGEPEYAAHLVLRAIASGKQVVLMNAELDATVGAELKARADAAGVVYTNVDGDEPGVAMNLVRFVRSIGYRPLAAGNIKGFMDRHRTPDTQRAFAEQVGQRPSMITSFADGTKLSLETALVANATGFSILEPGMRGPVCDHVNDAVGHFSADELLAAGGVVDYVLGAKPGTGAFVIGWNDDPVKRNLMRYFKMGDGPLYVFHTPFHLPHLEVAITVARAALFGDAAVAPLGAPTVDVVAYAKRDLAVGDRLDGIGGFAAYGVSRTMADSLAGHFLPMGLSEGCRVVRPVRADEPIPLVAVRRPPGRLVDELRAALEQRFFGRPTTGRDRNAVAGRPAAIPTRNGEVTP